MYFPLNVCVSFKDNLYLLQSRPITTLNVWSDFELTHELDYPVRSEHMVLTIGNIGEVMPNAMSVLTQTTSMLCSAWATELRLRNGFDPLGLQFIVRNQHRGVLDLVNVSKTNSLSSYCHILLYFFFSLFIKMLVMMLK